MTAPDGGVEVEVADLVGTLRLNRPAKLNAMDAAMRRALREGFAELEADDACRVIILAGAGRSFCVGADLKEMAANQTQVPPRELSVHLGRDLFVSKPVIAAVQGHALAGGFLLAQMCDLCIAADDAEFAVTEARRGRGSPWAAPLITKIPERAMLEILLTARPLGARRAYELGLVNAVVPRAALEETARSWAAEIAANAPLSVRAAKRMVRAACEMGRSAALDAADSIYEPVYLSEDAQEGPRAFAAGRAPRWQAR
jgi:enoyl-CoA hydratase